MNKDSFSVERTNYCKGIAIILLIIHHLFWTVPNVGIMIGDVSILQRIASTGKVCVSIFLLLSGIGLSKITCGINLTDKSEIKKFYKRRLGKLYGNYIFIVITSAIISMIFFEDIFKIMVGTGLHRLCIIILTCTGLQYFIGYQGFNGAWWFITAIVICYLLFPWIKDLVIKYGSKFLIVSFIISFIDFIPTGMIKVFTIISWIFPFILGVYIDQYEILSKIKTYILKGNSLLKKSSLICIFFGIFVIRQSMEAQSLVGIKVDYLLAVIMVLVIHVFWDNIKCLKKIFCYLGKKSMDIYYIHMFICTYFLDDFIYSLNSGLLMIFAVLFMNLAYSYFLDIIRFILKKPSEFIVSKIDNILKSRSESITN